MKNKIAITAILTLASVLGAQAQITPTNTVDVSGGFTLVSGYVILAAGFVVATITTILGLKAYGKWGSKAISGR